MTVLLVISGFSLILVNDNFSSLDIAKYSCGNLCSRNNRCTYYKFAVINCKNLIESNFITFVYAKLLYINDIAFSYLVLLTACCNNCPSKPPSFSGNARCARRSREG